VTRYTSKPFEDRVMDALMDYPQTAADIAERFCHHVDSVERCLNALMAKGLVEVRGKWNRHRLWQMRRTTR